MRNKRINTWKTSSGIIAILKVYNELLNEVDNVTSFLLNEAIIDLKNDSFDNVMDFLEDSKKSELLLYRKYFKKDFRMSKCIDIVLRKLNKLKQG